MNFHFLKNVETWLNRKVLGCIQNFGGYIKMISDRGGNFFERWWGYAIVHKGHFTTFYSRSQNCPFDNLKLWHRTEIWM